MSVGALLATRKAFEKLASTFQPQIEAVALQSMLSTSASFSIAPTTETASSATKETSIANTSASSATKNTSKSSEIRNKWSPQQRCFRNLMKSLRAAYFHDRSKLFWARHRVLVEMYKYSQVSNKQDEEQLIAIANEIAAFVQEYMKMNVERIVRHNEMMLKLSASKAKRYRQDYLLHEKQHESWCKQRIKNMMDRRPPPPYPFLEQM